MILSDLKYLATSHNQAVIINVGTRQVTTLALLSALRHAQMPVLLIDCESNDGSWDYFTRLMEDRPFDMLSAPLRQHGETLDWLFQNINCDNLLLIDSDLYGIHQCGIAAGSYFLVSDFISDGGSGISGSSDECLWREDRICLCDCWTCHSCYRGNDH